MYWLNYPSLISLCPILRPLSSFYKYWSLISIFHLKLDLSVCIQRTEPALVSAMCGLRKYEKIQGLELGHHHSSGIVNSTTGHVWSTHSSRNKVMGHRWNFHLYWIGRLYWWKRIHQQVWCIIHLKLTGAIIMTKHNGIGWSLLSATDAQQKEWVAGGVQ